MIKRNSKLIEFLIEKSSFENLLILCLKRRGQTFSKQFLIIVEIDYSLKNCFNRLNNNRKIK